jgi:hypothetical protein
VPTNAAAPGDRHESRGIGGELRPRTQRRWHQALLFASVYLYATDTMVSLLNAFRLPKASTTVRRHDLSQLRVATPQDGQKDCRSWPSDIDQGCCRPSSPTTISNGCSILDLLSTSRNVQSRCAHGYHIWSFLSACPIRRSSCSVYGQHIGRHCNVQL